MSKLLDSLSQETRQELRGLCQAAEDIDWPWKLALGRGWRVANPEYQRVQRELGLQEMTALLAALALAPPVSPAAAKNLVIAATQLFMVTDEFRVVSRTKKGELRLFGTRCPLYERFLDERWQGLTACGCFARRRGWYAALGGGITEELIMNRKWGDPACQVIVRIPLSGAAA